MGNRHQPSSFDQHWSIHQPSISDIPGYPQPVVNRNGTIAQLYELQFDSNHNIDNQIFLFEKRKHSKSGHTVQVLEIEAGKEKFLDCSGNRKYMRILTQNVAHRLHKQNKINRVDSLKILLGALKGFKQLAEQQNSYFQPSESMIGWTDRKSAKVWLNPDFSQNHLAKTTKSKISCEAMIWDIIYLLSSKTVNKKIVPINIQIKTFDDAIQMTNREINELSRATIHSHSKQSDSHLFHRSQIAHFGYDQIHTKSQQKSHRSISPPLKKSLMYPLRSVSPLQIQPIPEERYQLDFTRNINIGGERNKKSKPLTVMPCLPLRKKLQTEYSVNRVNSFKPNIKFINKQRDSQNLRNDRPFETIVKVSGGKSIIGEQEKNNSKSRNIVSSVVPQNRLFHSKSLRDHSKQQQKSKSPIRFTYYKKNELPNQNICTSPSNYQQKNRQLLSFNVSENRALGPFQQFTQQKLPISNVHFQILNERRETSTVANAITKQKQPQNPPIIIPNHKQRISQGQKNNVFDRHDEVNHLHLPNKVEVMPKQNQSSTISSSKTPLFLKQKEIKKSESSEMINSNQNIMKSGSIQIGDIGSLNNMNSESVNSIPSKHEPKREFVSKITEVNISPRDYKKNDETKDLKKNEDSIPSFLKNRSSIQKQAEDVFDEYKNRPLTMVQQEYQQIFLEDKGYFGRGEEEIASEDVSEDQQNNKPIDYYGIAPQQTRLSDPNQKERHIPISEQYFQLNNSEEQHEQDEQEQRESIQLENDNKQKYYSNQMRTFSQHYDHYSHEADQCNIGTFSQQHQAVYNNFNPNQPKGNNQGLILGQMDRNFRQELDSHDEQENEILNRNKEFIQQGQILEYLG